MIEFNFAIAAVYKVDCWLWLEFN